MVTTIHFMKMLNHIPGTAAVFLLSVATFLSCNNKDNKNSTAKPIDTVLHSKQPGGYVSSDQSPMDMSYFPEDYPLLKMNGDSAPPIARVIYSRPQKKGRLIFGNTEQSLRQYGKEWRLGANEATEIEFFREVSIAGKKVNKGRYIIYCIPYEDKWTIVLNNNLFTWGLHMDSKKDIFKTDIPTMVQSPSVEDFTMQFEPSVSGTDLLMAWDNVKAILPISFSK